MRIDNVNSAARSLGMNRSRLLALAALRLLYVGEIGIECPRDVEFERPSGAVAERRRDDDVIERKVVPHAYVNGSLGYQVLVGGLLVA
jgi:hypothetical protein